MLAAGCSQGDEPPLGTTGPESGAIAAFCTSAREATKDGFQPSDLKASKERLDLWLDQLAAAARNAPGERARKAAEDLEGLVGRARKASGADWVGIVKDASVDGLVAFATLVAEFNEHCG